MERLSNSKAGTEKVDDQIDHFQKLPSEIVLQIIEKLSEAKWLCMCYLVCTRFASLVPKTRHVSLRLSGSTPGESLHVQDNLPVFNNFLAKFESLQSLHLEVHYSIVPDVDQLYPYITKWKDMVYPNEVQEPHINLLCVSSILLLAKRVITTVNESDDNAEFDTMSTVSPLISKIYNYRMDSRMRYEILNEIIQFFPNLKEAVVTDSLNKGRLVVKEDSLDIMRLSGQNGKFINRYLKEKQWRRALLKLPLSGVVMEDALLVIFKRNVDDISIAENAFEENEFSEAALELMKEKPEFDMTYEDPTSDDDDNNDGDDDEDDDGNYGVDGDGYFYTDDVDYE